MNSFFHIWMDFHTKNQYKFIGASSITQKSQLTETQDTGTLGKKMLFFYIQRIYVIDTVLPLPDFIHKPLSFLPPLVNIVFAKGRLVSALFAEMCTNAHPCSVSLLVLDCSRVLSIKAA